MGTPKPSSAPRPESILQDQALASRLARSAIFRDYRAAFEDTTRLPLTLRAPGSFRRPLEGSKRINAFCALMADSNGSCASCLRAQQQLEKSARFEVQTEECEAGLNETLVPIRIGDRVIAYLQTGQVHFRNPTEAGFQRTFRRMSRYNLSPSHAVVKRAYFETRVIPPAQYASAVRLLEIFAQHLAVMSNQIIVEETADQSPIVSRARAYIARHFLEDLSLPDVARAAGVSPYYLCKLFRGETGTTVLDHISRLRVESAKRLLQHPHRRISEAAYEAGFQSLSQFNRVFRRITGFAPTLYRRRLQKGNGTIARAA